MTDPVSESAEMYLLRIALLSQDNDPVPISQLAETLDVSPISANQMSRKLEAKGLVTYQPYKGVSLTAPGEAIALRLVRKRRLWEVFLSDRLGLDPEVAEEIACGFEHVTPDALTERLADYLDHPIFSPQRQPIPAGLGGAPGQAVRPLTTLGVGKRARVTSVLVDDVLKAFLHKQHIGPGAEIKLLAAAEDRAVLLEADGQHITLDFDIAQKIDITPLKDIQPKADLTLSH